MNAISDEKLSCRVVWVGGRRIEHFKSKGRTGPIIDAEYHDIS